MNTKTNAATTGRPPRWTWADRLRKARREAGMTQEELAATIGEKKQTLAAWESGRTHPSDVVRVAQRVARATGYPAWWLLGLESPGTSSNDTELMQKRYFGVRHAERRRSNRRRSRRDVTHLPRAATHLGDGTAAAA